MTGQAGGSGERNGGEGPQVREARPPPGPRPSEGSTDGTRSAKRPDGSDDAERNRRSRTRSGRVSSRNPGRIRRACRR